MRLTLILFLLVCVSPLVYAQVEFSRNSNSLDITVNTKPLATYVFQDKQIYRPYFHTIRTLQGEQITRNHPPIEGKDRTDHAEYHPGLWMAFGDLNGHDFWRNKSHVKHVRFVEQPKPGNKQGSFSVLNHYMNDATIICQEECSIRVSYDNNGVYIFWDSVFFSTNDPFYFGDQEEMGFGIRMATPLIAKNGGTILNQQGYQNEKKVWGVQSPWCAYYGKNTSGEFLGALLMTAPGNFRSSWFHARDYGLLTANPFGRNAFTQKEKSTISIQKGERFSLSFGLYIFQNKNITDDFLISKYQTYISEIVKR